MSFELRWYQEDAINNTIKKLNDDRYALVHLSCGLGKSIICAELAKHYKNTVVCCPAMELVKQNYDKLSIQFGGADSLTMIDSAHKGEWNSNFVFTTPNTLYKNIDKCAEPSCLIIDELQSGYLAKMQKTILTNWKNCKVIGMTATPYYIDRKTIYKQGWMWSEETIRSIAQEMFGNPVISINYWDSLKLGYARPIEMKHTNIVKVRNIHFSSPIYQSILNKHIYELDILLSSLKNGVIYCDSIQHAEFVANNINGVKALFGTTPKKQRIQLVEDFLKGNVKFIATCQALQVGFDAPDLENIIVLSNYNSPIMTEQLLGRLNRGSCHKTCWYNSKLNTDEPIIGKKTLTKIRRL